MAKKVPERLLSKQIAVGDPQYQLLVDWAAKQTRISKATAERFIANLITAYEIHQEVRSEAYHRESSDEGGALAGVARRSRLICRQPKRVM